MRRVGLEREVRGTCVPQPGTAPAARLCPGPSVVRLGPLAAPAPRGAAGGALLPALSGARSQGGGGRCRSRRQARRRPAALLGPEQPTGIVQGVSHREDGAWRVTDFRK